MLVSVIKNQRIENFKLHIRLAIKTAINKLIIIILIAEKEINGYFL